MQITPEINGKQQVFQFLTDSKICGMTVNFFYLLSKAIPDLHLKICSGITDMVPEVELTLCNLEA